MADFERVKPGKIDEIKRWFVVYKTYEGKPENKIWSDGKVLGLDETMGVIEETHEEWKGLRSGKELAEKSKKYRMA